LNQKLSGLGLSLAPEGTDHSSPYKLPLKQPTYDSGRFFALQQVFSTVIPSAGRALALFHNVMELNSTPKTVTIAVHSHHPGNFKKYQYLEPIPKDSDIGLGYSLGVRIFKFPIWSKCSQIPEFCWRDVVQ
jgi:hypothetical protein